jgi:transposase InsO family protein
LAYVAFIIDAFRRYIVGGRVSNSLRSDLAIDALDALEMVIFATGDDSSNLSNTSAQHPILGTFE